MQKEKCRAGFLPAIAFKETEIPVTSVFIVTVTNFSLKRIAVITVLKMFYKQTET